MHHRLALLAGLLAVVVMAYQGYATAPEPLPLSGEARAVTGPDGYMRLLQAERLWASGDWFDRVSPLTNFPDGETLHWTRPLDLLLLAGAAPLAALFDLAPRDALYAWGIVLGPALQMLLVLALSWGTRPVLGHWGFVLAALMVCLLPLTRGAFAVARPDHHGLQLLLYFTQMMILLRTLHGGSVSARALLAAGLVAGLGIWVSPEALLGILILSLVLGALWLIHGPRFLGTITHYFWGLALATAAGFLLDRPSSEWLAEEHDRISIVHVTLTAAMAAAWSGLAALTPVREAGRAGRMVAGLAGVAVPAAVMAALFPRFFGGPFVDVDPRMQEAWFQWIQEVSPLLSTDPRVLAILIFSLGPLAVATPAAVHRLRKGGPAERQDALLFLVAMAVPIPLGLAQQRWAPYVELALVLPWTLLLVAILKWERPWPKIGNRPVPLRVPAFAGAFLGPFLVASIFAAFADTEKIAGNCDWPAVAPHIRTMAAEEGRRLALLTFVHQGPETVWRTDQAVVGSPYQRNHKGVLDTHAILGATDDATAIKILAARRVDFILVCRDGSERGHYPERGSLYRRLIDGDRPGWLHPVDLPEAAAGTFVMAEVPNRRR